MLDVNYSRGGFLLGIHKELWTKRKIYFSAPLAALIVAPPGAGKSTAVAIPNLLTLPTSCVVLDIKGELCDLTAGYRQSAFKNEVYVFNPLGNDNSLKFNPFDKKIISKLDFNGKRRLVDEIANTIFVEEKGEDHWVSKAKEFFVFHALYECCVKNESNFFDIANAPMKDYKPLIPKESPYYEKIYEFDPKTSKYLEIDGINPEKIFYQQVAEQKYLDIKNPKNWESETYEQIEANKQSGLETLDVIVRNYARAWANAADEEFASIKSTFSRFMAVFTSYQVRDATSSMSFEYEDLREKNITLYIKIAQTDIDTLKSLIRVLLESIAKNLMTRESKNLNERIYLILDEFIRFGKMPFLLEMPALCRSYNIVPLYITQSYGLIKKYYGEDDLKIMTDTTGYQILFKMNDADSAEQVSKQIGKYTRENRSHSTKDGAIAFGGTSSYSLEGTELITAQDILNIPNDEIIILVSGHKAKPIKIKAAYYYKEKAMQKRLKWEYDPTNAALLKKLHSKKHKNSHIESSQTLQVTTHSPKIQEQQPLEQLNEDKQVQVVQDSNTYQTDLTSKSSSEEDKKAQEQWNEMLVEDKMISQATQTMSENENTKTMSQEEINAQIQKMLEIKRKEYVKSINSDIINIALKNPPKDLPPTENSEAKVSLDTWKKIQKDTNPLIENAGFSLRFSMADLKNQ
ncbi:type IV secretory system conjugative DNA transfer family protein [Helicobacter jaachi]|uniref:Type IV secretory system conjugative DNA transfer family protein n=2 Tax=Helicobacter jaachi TaxID=1677920 RepID=A0A4U8T782_9HELI|nr:type IV secretory system conjugative DNA transfer family protein [Helicobacter jaachi]